MAMFGWCMENRHSQCIQKFRPFTIDTKTNKVVYSDEWRYCKCSKRGCKCHVSAKERKKTKTRRKS